MKRRVAHTALLLLAMTTPGCAIPASRQAAPIEVAPPPAEGMAAKEPVATISLKFGSGFEPNAMTAFNIDNFTFHVSEFCPSPKASGTSAIGTGTYVNGKFHCNAHSLYYWPNAVHGMPHWHMLSVAYTCGSSCVLPLRPETNGKGFIFKPPYLVLSPAGKGVPSESVFFGTLKVSRTNGQQRLAYAEQVAVQNPAPPTGISVTLSDNPPDMEVCSREIACGQTATSVTIPSGSKTALFYLRPFPNVSRLGKHHFVIAAVARGCEMGTDGGTILYSP